MAGKDNCYNKKRRIVLYFIMMPVSMISEVQMEWTIFIFKDSQWISQYSDWHSCFLESSQTLKSFILIEVFMGSLCIYTNLLQQYPQIQCDHFLSHLFKFNLLSHITIWCNAVNVIKKRIINKWTEVQQQWSLYCTV
jgi:hypothetical protein